MFANAECLLRSTVRAFPGGAFSSKAVGSSPGNNRGALCDVFAPNSRHTNACIQKRTRHRKQASNWPRALTLLREESKHIAVCGGGSFGSALAFALANAGHQVVVLVRRPEVAETINLERTNPRYTAHAPNFRFPANVRATTCSREALRHCWLCVHAIPVQSSRAFIEEKVRPHLAPGTPILSTSKGIELNTGQFMYEILESVLGKSDSNSSPLLFLSGPSFAHEILASLPAAVVLASADGVICAEIASEISSPALKIFRSSDVVGVEVSGAVKNVIALAAGVCEGLGLGMNATAALVTRGCSEMRRLAMSLGARSVTIAGLSGVGDTFMTCFGAQSRNRTVGFRLGQGETLDHILSTSTQVAEGVPTAKAVAELIAKQFPHLGRVRLALKFPILLGVTDVLENKVSPREKLEEWMDRRPRIED
ncbi:hypothetical protein CCYA_CCYA13G3628 [Cyanidiococcus yangmingshanensis]|nr:hypothetical protein CCYA_CCYA13G3628 [Cyanidiococcus yangmingshanensis]